ncbi:uncharacterized protein EV422DRAFT_567042 [Fimicolochytrium jonesii]|uniref:uncharacterized protein n=1 Tax=Fimicolochytrium jonesii TaxID=1396493 RepID=UPI0022FE52AE|nr:uncharacterized protein EV422DRAFT_567042 [Fimicolochytrium jonesii]KAI8821299.1 hypothetical protein EV422DRAFT_567042 [Fimicolochytrium jonesii]
MAAAGAIAGARMRAEIEKKLYPPVACLVFSETSSVSHILALLRAIATNPKLPKDVMILGLDDDGAKVLRENITEACWGLGLQARFVAATPADKSAVSSFEALPPFNHKKSSGVRHYIFGFGLRPQPEPVPAPINDLVNDIGLANPPGQTKPWTSARFSAVERTFNGTALESAVTYPRFLATQSGGFQLFYRSGISGNGQGRIAEYAKSTLKTLGAFRSALGTYVAPNKNTSITRKLDLTSFVSTGHKSASIRDV